MAAPSPCEQHFSSPPLPLRVQKFPELNFLMRLCPPGCSKPYQPLLESHSGLERGTRKACLPPSIDHCRASLTLTKKYWAASWSGSTQARAGPPARTPLTALTPLRFRISRSLRASTNCPLRQTTTLTWYVSASVRGRKNRLDVLTPEGLCLNRRISDKGASGKYVRFTWARGWSREMFTFVHRGYWAWSTSC